MSKVDKQFTRFSRTDHASRNYECGLIRGSRSWGETIEGRRKKGSSPSLSLVVRERVHVGLRKAESTRLPLKVPPCPGDKETYYE